MLIKVFQTILGCFNLCLYALMTIMFAIFVHLLAICKYLIPIPAWQKQCTKWLRKVPVAWGVASEFFMRYFTSVQLEVVGMDKLSKNDWYLMTANHQSWTDIPLLVSIFSKKIPVLKFFIKSQILWIPFLGSSCWLIGYPFMKRYTKEQIAKNPKLKGKDLETTKKKCEHFKSQPISILSFAEGTRYTKEKAKRQNTPYQYLLKPRAGGLAYTLAVMGDYLNKMIDVTIVYPDGNETFWDYLCGRLKRVVVKVNVQDLSDDIKGDYINDREFRVHFQSWLNDLWQQKDNDIATIMESKQ